MNASQRALHGRPKGELLELHRSWRKHYPLIAEWTCCGVNKPGLSAALDGYPLIQAADMIRRNPTVM